MKNKKWYTSKTMWVNLISAGAILVQVATGKEMINAEAQAAILAVVNVILRIVSNDKITL